ncbi:hypothetical protein GMES_4235 [Paraglaciecola mesophila KMM 241]|uniref:Uncharacterized protein n=1 Tax=Paraglaciecola mesophila KMM 241 TaxID=1128912 RepID=K6YR93_9ALTE|nr:hypothetical protein GMES_4235 [Paraglaciecola mesophila KMM 241]
MRNDLTSLREQRTEVQDVRAGGISSWTCLRHSKKSHPKLYIENSSTDTACIKQQNMHP